MIRALAIALLATPAAAQETRTWGTSYASSPGTSVTIDAPQRPNAVASVTFFNSVHDGARKAPEPFVLTYRGTAVGMSLTRGDSAPDILTVDDLPEELVAVPDRLEIRDGDTAVIHIYPRDALALM